MKRFYFYNFTRATKHDFASTAIDKIVGPGPLRRLPTSERKAHKKQTDGEFLLLSSIGPRHHLLPWRELTEDLGGGKKISLPAWSRGTRHADAVTHLTPSLSPSSTRFIHSSSDMFPPSQRYEISEEARTPRTRTFLQRLLPPTRGPGAARGPRRTRQWDGRCQSPRHIL